MAETKFTLMPTCGEKEESFITSILAPDLVKAFQSGGVIHGHDEKGKRLVINLKAYRYMVSPEGA